MGRRVYLPRQHDIHGLTGHDVRPLNILFLRGVSAAATPRHPTWYRGPVRGYDDPVPLKPKLLLALAAVAMVVVAGAHRVMYGAQMTEPRFA